MATDKHLDKEMGGRTDGYSPEGSRRDEEVGIVVKGEPLQRDLQSRHMQMIAIGTC